MVSGWQMQSGASSEDADLKNLARWLDIAFEGCWYHPPNGGKRTKKAAGILKNMGTKRGVPDVILEAPFGDWKGCRLEFKDKGLLSPEQRRWLAYYALQGFYTVTCWGSGAAIAKLIDIYPVIPYEPPRKQVHLCYTCMEQVSEEDAAQERYFCANHQSQRSCRVLTINSMDDFDAIMDEVLDAKISRVKHSETVTLKPPPPPLPKKYRRKAKTPKTTTPSRARVSLPTLPGAK